ncbi:MAG: glycosyltransferase family 2 protein [Alphaproteobacteria bacterium]|nr:glycosyltransferase family 2 protein [Alphaproteobacteria bacterium]
MFNKSNIILILVSVLLIYTGFFGYLQYKKYHPKVSVILTTYNAEKYVDSVIPMFLQSEWDDFELVVIDDESSDKTWSMLQQWEREDSRIRIYRNEKNLGICGNRNRGLELSRGQYIAMMDPDDISLPQRLKVSAEYLDSHPETDVVDVDTILKLDYEKGIENKRAHVFDYVLSRLHKSTDLYTEAEKDENIKLGLLFSLAVPTHSASMMRKEFLEKHNIRYNKDVISDDYYLYLDMVQAGAKFHHIPEILAIYNDTPHHSNTFNQRQYNETQEAKRQLYEWAGLDYSLY